MNIPPNYVCSTCRAYGVKLWRDYPIPRGRLLCCDCAAKDQGKDVSHIESDGRHQDYYGVMTDQIGWMVPAVPAFPDTFWGYTAVPENDIQWWKSLPNRTEVQALTNAVRSLKPAPKDGDLADPVGSLKYLLNVLEIAPESVFTEEPQCYAGEFSWPLGARCRPCCDICGASDVELVTFGLPDDSEPQGYECRACWGPDDEVAV